MFERLFSVLLPFLAILFIIMFIFPFDIIIKLCVWIGMGSIALFFFVEYMKWCLDSNNSNGVDYEQYKKDNPHWMYPTDKEPWKDEPIDKAVWRKDENKFNI